METSKIQVGDLVEHCMGHRGRVVDDHGTRGAESSAFRVLVQFQNTTSWVWLSDLTKVEVSDGQ